MFRSIYVLEIEDKLSKYFKALLNSYYDFKYLQDVDLMSKPSIIYDELFEEVGQEFIIAPELCPVLDDLDYFFEDKEILELLKTYADTGKTLSLYEFYYFKKSTSPFRERVAVVKEKDINLSPKSVLELFKNFRSSFHIYYIENNISNSVEYMFPLTKKNIKKVKGELIGGSKNKIEAEKLKTGDVIVLSGTF